MTQRDRRLFRLNVEVRIYRDELEGNEFYDEIYAIVRVDDNTDSQRYTAVTPGLEFDKCMDATWIDNHRTPYEKLVADALRVFCTRWGDAIKSPD